MRKPLQKIYKRDRKEIQERYRRDIEDIHILLVHTVCSPCWLAADRLRTRPAPRAGPQAATERFGLPPGLLSDEVQGDRARMRRTAVFPEIDPLPRPQRQSAVGNRYGEIDGGKGRADMRGHVVVALRRVHEK